MTKTITVQIGNSDNKLTQEEWYYYAEMVGQDIKLSAWEIHFSGASNPLSKWQNACWVFEIEEDRIAGLKVELVSAKYHFNQELIAWLEGETELI